MIRMRRLLTAVAAALLAAAPTLAAQADAPNPLSRPQVERQRDERFRGEHLRWHRGRQFERRGARMERRGERWERRGERFERRGQRMRHHRHREFERRRRGRWGNGI